MTTVGVNGLINGVLKRIYNFMDHQVVHCE